MRTFVEFVAAVFPEDDFALESSHEYALESSYDIEFLAEALASNTNLTALEISRVTYHVLSNVGTQSPSQKHAYPHLEPSHWAMLWVQTARWSRCAL